MAQKYKSFLSYLKVMVWCDGMATMTCRTTFAFDQETIHRLKKMATRWSVSQAEVIRRCLSQAEERFSSDSLDPVAMLTALHTSGKGLSKKAGNAYLREVYEERKAWRKQ